MPKKVLVFVTCSGVCDMNAELGSTVLQVEAAQSVSQRKGAGLMGHIYSRKLEQAQQVLSSLSLPYGVSVVTTHPCIVTDPEVLMRVECIVSAASHCRL